MVNMNTNTGLILLASTSIMAYSAPAIAQEAPNQDNVGLTEIVVTAQKRAQNLQDVPIAISAIGTEKIEKLGISDSRDLSGLAPNVTITQGTTSGAAAVISIRGIPTPATETFGLDTSNGLYVDGIYIGRSGASGLDVMDIERVEVLRGPQGTLFGRNTTGGAISFISRAPSTDFRLKAEAGYGNFNAWNGRISVDPGEFAGISTSFSYSHRERDGVIDNILEPRDSKDPGARKSDSFRIAAKADIGGTGSIQYIFDWTKLTSSPNAFQLTNTANGAVRPPFAVDGQTVVPTQQAPVAQYLAGVTFAQPECAALAVARREYRDQVCNDISSVSKDKTWGHNLQVQNDFGPFAIKATTGYRFWKNSSNTDLDGIGGYTGPLFTQASLLNGLPIGLLNLIQPPATAAFLAASPVPTTSQNLFDTNNQRDHKQLSQEIEISGDTNSFDWVVGGFYFWEKGSEFNPQNSGFALDTNGIFLGNFGALGPALAAANPARYRLAVNRSILAYTATNESTALYGQATFYPGGRDSGLRVTAGGRYTWDTKKMTRSQNGALPYATLQTGDASFNKFTWNLMLGYDIADGISAYARAATGYRSGGFNAQDTASPDPANPGRSLLPSFNEESVTSYELGLKTELFDRRVRFNIAGYHNIYDDLAVVVPFSAVGVPFASRISNAGSVKYWGVEAELQAILSDNFSIDGSIGYVDTQFKKFLAGQSTTPGNPLVNIASIVTPQYSSPLTGNIALNAQFPLGSTGARLNGRVGYTHEDGKYSFASINANPLNEALKGDDRDIIDAQIGVDRIKFGAAEGEIKIWGKNLTNSKDFVRAIDFGQLGFGGGYYADPRTYGMTIGIKY